MSEDQNNIVTLKVRVTAEFREKIATTAKENNRSMNAEIVARLEQSFSQNQNDFNAGYSACMAHMVVATSKVLSEKGIPWDQVQKTLVDVVNDFQRLSAEKK